MSEDKTATVKRTPKKAVADTEVAKPKKAAAPAKAAAKPVADKAPAKTATKAPVATKATTAKEPAKKAAADTAVAKPKKAAPATAKTATKAPAAAKAKAAKPKSEAMVKRPPAPSYEERQNWIATAAYHRAEKRGFVPGYEAQDWLDAEAEIDALIGKG
ncbi:MAG: DUF2934 domain-containing protein [Hydrogenophilaceae bacterium]